MKTIPLTKGKVAIVDDEDFEALSAHKWYAIKGGTRFYAVRSSGKPTKIKMHRAIMQPRDGMDIDHISGDGLDNRRENLRVATRSQNMMNVGVRKNNNLGVKGVRLHQGKYEARIQINGRLKYLGRFPAIPEAAAAYAAAAQIHHGEFARV
jgi:hypothetical protein